MAEVFTVAWQRLDDVPAGDGGFAWACGFTQPYDEAVAAQWKEVFGG